MGGEWQGMTSFLSKPFTARANLEREKKMTGKTRLFQNICTAIVSNFHHI